MSTTRYTVPFGSAMIDTTVTSDTAAADEWLCVGTKCLVLQMFYANRVPAAIRGLLGDPAVRCVGEDAAKLSDDYGLVCAAPVDLEGHCNEYLGIGGLGRRRLGLKGYAREVLGMTMEKPWHVTMSNWERRQLEVAQVQYACIDAYVSYKLGERLLDN
ncbi:hypothetical protein ZWY2020_032557 [Hordeum vulgare]|nr:hypothetical protein ZWY2020_032557 [Hordeum vulgare]